MNEHSRPSPQEYEPPAADEAVSSDDEILKEFSEFCSNSWIKAKGGCCRMICTMDEFLPQTEAEESPHEY